MFEGEIYKDILKACDRVYVSDYTKEYVIECMINESAEIISSDPIAWNKVGSIVLGAWFLDVDDFIRTLRRIVLSYVDNENDLTIVRNKVQFFNAKIMDTINRIMRTLDEKPIEFENISEKYLERNQKLTQDFMINFRGSIDVSIKLSIKMQYKPIVEAILDKSIEEGHTIEQIMKHNPEMCKLNGVSISEPMVRKYGDEFFPNKMIRVREIGIISQQRRIYILKRNYSNIARMLKDGADDLTILSMYPELVKDNKPIIETGFTFDDKETLMLLRRWADRRRLSFTPCTDSEFINHCWYYKGVMVDEKTKIDAMNFVKSNNLPESMYIYKCAAKKIMDN